MSDLHGWSGFEPCFKPDARSGAKLGLPWHIPSLQIFAILCSDGGENAGFNGVLVTIATKFPHFM